MTQKWLLTILGALFGLTAMDAAAVRAETDPLIIRGLGGEGGRGMVPPVSQAPAPRAYPARRLPAPTTQYGGGFIELLMTGGSGHAPGVARSAVPPAAVAPPVAAYPMTAAPVLVPAHNLVAYAPSPRLAPRREIDPRFRRQEVDYDGPQKPGTLVIDTPNKFLYLVEPGGRALRYGIGVGRPGFMWSGVKSISRKAEWPDWTPPPEMLLRRPDLPLHMDGGPENPLGARAMYLGSSLFRIHGTNEPETIGTNVSSGCIRLTNDDVMDLYDRVKVGAKVVVM
jgi:lipoprotein-anchoring transpeptidase ErfK/SrfK